MIRLVSMALPVLFSIGCSAFGKRTVEEPSFEIVEKDGDKEVRLYEEQLIAKTFISGTYEDSTSKGFRLIADYIFGENTANTEIAMTAPVVQEPKSEKISMTAPVVRQPEDGGWTMYFIMPSKYTLETLPKPKDPRVKIATMPAKKVAVFNYSGLTDEEEVETYGAELLNWLESKGYKPVSKPRSARYNPPWTLPFLRHNEVQIDVK